MPVIADMLTELCAFVNDEADVWGDGFFDGVVVVSAEHEFASVWQARRPLHDDQDIRSAAAPIAPRGSVEDGLLCFNWGDAHIGLPC